MTRPIEDWYLPADGNDWAPAWDRCMGQGDGAIPPIRTDHPWLGGEVTFGARIYRFTRPMHVTRRMTIRGEGPDNTQFQFYECAGIRFWYLNADPEHPRQGGSAVGSWLGHLSLRFSGRREVAQGAVGLHVDARVSVSEVEVSSFPSDGVRMVSNAPGSPPTNCNISYFEHVRSLSNGGSGWRLAGADSNASMFVMCDATSNDGWGVDDGAFLGNWYLGIHTAGNKLGSFRATDPNQRGLWVVYSEGGQPPGSIQAPNLVLNPIGDSGTGGAPRVEAGAGEGRLVGKWHASGGLVQFGAAPGEALYLKDPRDLTGYSVARTADAEWSWYRQRNPLTAVLKMRADAGAPAANVPALATPREHGSLDGMRRDKVPDATAGKVGDVVLCVAPTETLDGWRKVLGPNGAYWRPFSWSPGT